jgi:glutathione S-transferase
VADALTLTIANKNYSSWSLRSWFLLSALDVPFREQRLPLAQPDTRQRILSVSPSGRVPVLQDGELTVWDSLAICEYVAERFADRAVWPRDAAARALARSISAEMHAGFAALRSGMPMNCRARGRTVVRNAELAQDIERVQSIWRTCRTRFGTSGPWLFGAFSAADAMYAPVAFRFATYGVDGDDAVRTYGRTLLDHPAMRRWAADAAAEPEIIDAFEAGVPSPPVGKA